MKNMNRWTEERSAAFEALGDYMRYKQQNKTEKSNCFLLRWLLYRINRCKSTQVRPGASMARMGGLKPALGEGIPLASKINIFQNKIGLY